MFSFRLAGSLLFRFAERTFLGSLFQLPPRRTRFEPPLIRRGAACFRRRISAGEDGD